MSAITQIRATIELFTTILKENGCSKIKAETFRLAKFNKDEAVPHLWRLLFELLYYCQYGKIDDIALKAEFELSREELVMFVKHEMQDRGFASRDFALLPLDMTEGSRVLLLAAGWLICKEHILDKFMYSCTSPLDDDTSSLYQDDDINDINIVSKFNSPPEDGDHSDRLHQLLWLNNKLRLNLRKLHAIYLEKNKLKHRVHEATQGVSLGPERNHLTMLEVFMLRHPEVLEKNLQLLDKDNQRLQHMLDWRDHEDKFWKWMGSVLDAKLQEMQEVETDDNLSDVTGPVQGIPQPTIQRLQENHLNLREAIVKYEAIVEYMERLYDEQVSEISEEELNSVLASIELELSIQRANITLMNTESYLRKERDRYQSLPNDPPPTAARAIVQQRHQERLNFVPAKQAWQNRGQQPAPPPRPSSMMSSDETWRDIEEEIVSLQDTVEKLQLDIVNRQESYQMQLAQAAAYDDAVVIPPMKTAV